MPPATAPIPVPACCREPGAPQPATRLPAAMMAMIRTKAEIKDRDVIIATPPDYGGVSLENAAAIAPRFIRSLPVLRRRIGSRTCRAVG